jgi:hypothetical protein
MPYSVEGRARIVAAVAASNRRRGEQDQERRLARNKWRHHKGNAKTRGVRFLLAFDDWWDIWKRSGKWPLRGTHAGQYCMSRFGDAGAYEAGNVFINLFAQNTSDGVTGIKRTPEQNAARSVWMRGNTNGAGRKWVSRDGASTCVPNRMVQTFLSDGWRPGRVFVRCKRA